MDVTTRERLIDEYVTALDEDDPDRFVDVITDDFVYYYEDGRDFHGKDGVLEFLRYERSLDTTHTFTDLYHQVECTVGLCEATVHAEPPRRGTMCDVFVFDEDEGKFSEITIYSRWPEER